MFKHILTIALLLGLLGGARTDLRAAQAAPARPPAVLPEGYAAVPFHPGERAQYQVKLGGVSVGRGSMEVVGLESISGHPVYHTQLRLSGGIPLARVDDKLDSWIDARGLFSRRFRQDVKEVRYKRLRTYDFFPEARTWRRENGEVGTLTTNVPLDDVSFLFYARTLPLRVGETYTIRRYFKESGNPVVLQVLRRETVTVPAGRFETVVVRPIIQTDGLFGQGGEAEVYFTDDARRIMVMMRSKVPVVGSLTMHLQSYEAGEPIRAAPGSH